ncbi:flagellar basal body P-ring protein FlgI [Rhodoblastus acidophilus]|uniref:Flagellar P-ring protein n=1 Tax=Candidatus Rhodoblastus alkanivorans TaxID=2954117 RepID=A0ABS9Z3G3_9HYPH|nr:flagellar basal body P-ring protein FlgI [Candidatus Rhodoblastus alkanivorans]MCI4678825.1 flagellar basal body P-ring protein FlgI [Candidatus Rhodoblastus alkanivorans]MCI4682214.1 flagellar basal body P-ring protein FlgI [Candidatus Rhodoblastus alkanivorans]MDI4639516.1 flagellar basal body P-ring protein FlgI [Rhodoblastus acidophilus]
MRFFRACALAVMAVFAFAHAEAAVRIKDITSVKGVRDNQLVGYGLVVGLQGTGDSLQNAPFTGQSLQAMLDRMGVNVRNVNLRTRNVAAVMVTADLPPFAARGTHIDVTVSSMGDASSLMGGTLLLTTMSGANGQVYAVAQGAVSVTGFATQGQAETLTQGVPTAGHISNGATVEREIASRMPSDGALNLELNNPDFATAVRIADAINRYSWAGYHRRTALEQSPNSVALHRPPGVGATHFIAEIGELMVEPDAPARVVIDSRTGTVVIGLDVQISPVAVTQGTLTVRVTETPQVSQPAPFSHGRTVVTPQTQIQADEGGGWVAVIGGRSLRGLVHGLNRIGAKPPTIIAILQAIKAAGALQADIVVQ